MPRGMAPGLVTLMAERFKVLSEPARLQLLDVLRNGEQTVGELVERTGHSQANVSKHLQMLHRAGFVRRRKEGLFVRYALADRDVFRLCDIMSGRLGAETRKRTRALATTGRTPA